MNKELLAPIPIIHVEAMQQDIAERKGTKFAFGSAEWEFFKDLPNNCESQDIQVYVYLSKTEMENIKAKHKFNNLGVLVKARLIGWIEADFRGQYPKQGTAIRPSSTINDSKWKVFWEIDNVEFLDKRIPLSDFCSADNKRGFKENSTPQKPVWVIKKTIFRTRNI